MPRASNQFTDSEVLAMASLLESVQQGTADVIHLQSDPARSALRKFKSMKHSIELQRQAAHPVNDQGFKKGS